MNASENDSINYAAINVSYRLNRYYAYISVQLIPLTAVMRFELLLI